MGFTVSQKNKGLWSESESVELGEPRACYRGEVSQKEKNRSHMLMHTVEPREMVTMEPSHRRNRDGDAVNARASGGREGRRAGWGRVTHDRG